MPISPTYPGVYVQEVPSGVRTIIGVGTSITAFIGRALRGPTNEPTTVNGFADFERIFGGLWINSRLGFAVRDFFVNGGGQGIVVRLFHPTFKDKTERDQAFTAADAVATAAKGASGGTDPMTEASATAVKTAATTKAGTYTTEPEKTAAAAVAKAVDAAAKKDAKLADVTKAIDVAVGQAAPVTRASFALGKTQQLKLEAAYEGAWGNALRGRIERPASVPDSLANLGFTKDDVFNLIIRDTGTGDTESFFNLTLDDPARPSPRGVTKVLENESRLVRATAATGVPEASDDGITDEQKKIVPFSKEDKDIRSTGVKASDYAGDGIDLTRADFTTGPNLEANKQGLYALERLFARDGLFNLLVIPPYQGLDTSSGDVEKDLLSDAVSYCDKRRAMLLVDPLSTWTDKDTAKNEFSSGAYPAFSHKNAALLFPRLKESNPLRDNQLDEFVPSGAVAGIFARTDTQRGVWKAPAGLDATLLGVPELSVPLTDEENGELNPLGINCLRTFPIVGKVVWGSRTLRGADQLADEWKYIPVRRTALFLEESLYRGLKWVVFEPNDEPLWAQIRLNVGAFMQGLFRQGAFQGKTPQEAYFVKCDRETNPQDEINKGIVNVVVGFAPLKPAEFVIIKIQQMAGQLAA
jgi:phage tail sheath protein FI